MIARKWLFLLFGVLFLGIPFEHYRISIFRPMARSILHRFEAKASFPLTLPEVFEKHIHFYISDVILVLIVALMMWMMRPKLRIFLMGPHSRYLTLFFFAGILSLLFSLFHGYYIQYFHLLHFAIILLGFHATRLFFEGNQQLIVRLLVGIALISCFECLIGIGQFLMQGPVGLSVLGEIPLSVEGNHIATLPLTPTNRKFIEFFTTLPEGRAYLIRASGTFLHPNIFAAFLALSLMITIFLFTQAKRKVALSFLILLLILQMFSLFLTFSRAGVIAWILGLFVWFGFSSRMNLTSREKKRMKILGSLLSVGLGVSIVVLLPFLLARGGFFNYNALVQGSDQFRIGYQQSAFKMIKDHPLFGMGFNCSTLAPAEYFPVSRNWVHNIYLLIGAEMGLLGLSFFALFCFSLLRSFWKSNITLLSTTLCAIFVGFLFIGLCDFYFLIVQTGKLMFFLFTGLFSAAIFQKESLALLSRHHSYSS